jgi:hypothetical protein
MDIVFSSFLQQTADTRPALEKQSCPYIAVNGSWARTERRAFKPT